MMKTYLQSIVNHVVSFVFPAACAVCGRGLSADDRIGVCGECLDNIELIKGYFCVKCGKALPDGGEYCYTCAQNRSYHFEFIRSAGEYKGNLRKLLHRFKYLDRDYYVRIFDILIRSVLNREKILNEADCIVPVPLHWIKRLMRGYNQSELLALGAAKYCGKPVLKNVLVRRKMTKSQFHLGKEERKKNLENAFRVVNSSEIKGKKVILIDDIATTCETIEHCSRELRNAGAKKVYAVTVAKD